MTTLSRKIFFRQKHACFVFNTEMSKTPLKGHLLVMSSVILHQLDNLTLTATLCLMNELKKLPKVHQSPQTPLISVVNGTVRIFSTYAHSSLLQSVETMAFSLPVSSTQSKEKFSVVSSLGFHCCSQASW